MIRFRCVLLVILVLASPARASFVNFESGHVRPLAYLASANLLFAVNTPDGRLAVFEASAGGLVPRVEIPVGLEPVAVAVRELPGNRAEAWVVNHLSDSVSVVELDLADLASARVSRTLLVGDEPRDVVLAGSTTRRAFITTAHRGQNRPGDSLPFTPGVGRADVWVFDADAPGVAFGGNPITIAELLGDVPRALARSVDGSRVHAAVFHSGNGTTTVNQLTVALNGGSPPDPPGTTPGAIAAGLIVRRDPSNGRWEDELARDWSAHVRFGLPDLDVFTLDADAPIPAVVAAVAGVGTTLFNLAVRPDNGKIYVANTEARNEIRFEPTLTGDITESRITVVSGTTPTAIGLNPHIDYGVIPGPPGEVAESLAFPTDMVFSSDGQTLYVAVLGSGKIAVFDTDLLEADAAFPRESLDVGGGPTGVVLDEGRDRLYVMNRLDHTIAIVGDASTPLRALAGSVPVGQDPSPAAVTAGRRFLYDARTTSAHGDAACASCHMFGDADQLAWDLGDPFGSLLATDNPTTGLGGGAGVGVTYHPMKGPLLTQSLRGMRDTGPLHWRGDRTAAAAGGDAYDSAANFRTFNVAFPSLLGRATALTPAEMDAFAAFALTIRYPPNPYRPLDDVPTPAQARGEDLFRHKVTDGAGACQACHALPLSTNGRVGIGFFSGQPIKVPHFRNAYQKVGRFGLPAQNDHQLTPYTVGDQVRGFGLQADGSLTSLLDFHGGGFFFSTPTERRDVSEFVLAMDTGLKPAVGQQVTAAAITNADAALAARLALLVARDDAGDCDVVAHGRRNGAPRGWLHGGGGWFVSDRVADGAIDDVSLRAQAAVSGQELTFTCVPSGSGIRMGIDRDEDGFGDAEEIEAGSDPLDPHSGPVGFQTVRIPASQLALKDKVGPPAKPASRRFAFQSKTKLAPPSHRIVVPPPGSASDPRTAGARITIYNASGTGEVVVADLAPAGWVLKGSPSAPKGYAFKATDKEAPITAVTVGSDLLKIRGGRRRFGYTLDEPSQGSIALRLRFGTAFEWCTVASGATDQVDKFKGAPAAAPASCPPR